MTTHFTFFINITKDHLNDVYDYIFKNKEHYLIEKFIVSYEENTSKGKKPHIHFYGVFNIETLDYTHKMAFNLCKVFVDKYKLRKSQKGGKVNYGCGKEQGKLKKTPEQAMTYHTKEKQYLFFGWPDEYVQECSEKSFIQEKENKLDYQKLLKDKIFKLWEEKYPNPTGPCNLFLHQPFPLCVETKTWYEGDKDNKINHDYHYKQVEVIQKYVFKELLKEEKDIKSFALVKSITRYIIQYSKHHYIQQNRFELFKSNN